MEKNIFIKQTTNPDTKLDFNSWALYIHNEVRKLQNINNLQHLLTNNKAQTKLCLQSINQ